MNHDVCSPLVSVIIPIYNVENYLRECLESVVNQTLKDIEVICVDDGSTDNSAAVASEYVEKYSCFKLLRKENGGQSSARNMALNIAKGRYVYFLDSDDYIAPTTLEEVCLKALSENLDIVFFNTLPFFESKEIQKNNQNYIDFYNRKGNYSGIYSGQTLFAMMRKNREFFGSPCLEIFRRELIVENHVRFFEGIIHEDNLFTLQCTILSNRVGYLDKYFYYRRVHSDSTMTAQKSLRNVEGYMVSYAEMLVFLHNRKIDEDVAPILSDYLYHGMYRNACNILNSLGLTEDEVYFSKGDFVASHLLDLAKYTGAIEAHRNSLKVENMNLKNKLRKIEQEVTLLKASKGTRSFRYLLAKVKGGVQCLKDHGLSYTLRLAEKKLWNITKKIDKSLSHISIYRNVTSIPRKIFYSVRKLRQKGIAYTLRALFVRVYQKTTIGPPRVSFILPVYNVEEFLEQGMNTLLQQSMRHIEIIAVDDGSTDRSLEILNHYAATDKRVRVFTQKNQFAGAARNLGLLHARGEYVIFLDSDDFFAKGLAKDTYYVAKTNKADVVLFGAKHYNNSTKQYREAKWLFNEQFAPQKQPFSYKDCPQNLYRITTPCPWTKMFRREFLLNSGLQFQTLQNSNDVFFTYSALAAAERIATLNRPLVYYRVGLENSLQSTKKKNPLCFYQAYKALHDKLIDLGAMDLVRQSYVNVALSGCLYNLRSISDLDAKQLVYDALKNEIFDALELTGHAASFYYSKKDYEKLQDIVQQQYDYEYFNEVSDQYYAQAVRAWYKSVTGQELAGIGNINHVSCAGKYVENSSPLAFLNPCYRLYEKLIELDAMDAMRQTYVNLTLTVCIQNLHSASSPEERQLVYDALKNEVFDALELSGHDESYYWNKAEYEELQNIVSREYDYQYFSEVTAQYYTQAVRAWYRSVTAQTLTTAGNVSNDNYVAKYVENDSVLVFLNPCYRLHASLTELGAMDALRQRYVNLTLAVCIRNLYSTSKKRQLVYDALKNEVFDALELSGYDESYYWNKAEYRELQSIISREYDYQYFSELSLEYYPQAVKKWYLAKTGWLLNLEHPVTYNDKINWVKLYEHNSLKTKYADKYAVRDYVAQTIGDQYLVPLLGVWENADEIDFNSLPNQFVLKATHGSGWNIIVKDKDDLDISNTVKKLRWWQNRKLCYCNGLELHYKDVEPRIIAEQYLENSGGELYDYKVWCFNGKAHFIQFLAERKSSLKMAFYDLEWKKLPFIYDYPQYEKDVKKPDNLNELIWAAEKLAKPFNHVRVDFYRLNSGELKFGEMTFTPSGGRCKWNPEEYNAVMGQLFDLNYSAN